MKLLDYRKQQRLSRAKAGAAIGVCGITVWRWETGRSRPTYDTARRIINWSNGAITFDEIAAERAAA